MLGILITVLYTAVVIVALLMIGVILIQPSKSGGFGGSFGGVGESVFGAYAGSHLSRLTVILISLFFILTLLLAVITSHKAKDKSVAEINAVKADLTAKAVVNVKAEPLPVAAKEAQPAGNIPAKTAKPAGNALPENKAGSVNK
ncbi:MAG: preprotein translocase subunit SecG [Victivallaceae bacterium]|jgi:preprotein translocase subunit SecG